MRGAAGSPIPSTGRRGAGESGAPGPLNALDSEVAIVTPRLRAERRRERPTEADIGPEAAVRGTRTPSQRSLRGRTRAVTSSPSPGAPWKVTRVTRRSPRPRRRMMLPGLICPSAAQRRTHEGKRRLGSSV